MSVKILITGGTGLVGMKLSAFLVKKGFKVLHLSRNENLTATYPAYRWDISKEVIDPKAMQVDYVIHLAGTGVADKRWSKQRKQEIYDSRIRSTRLLVNTILNTKNTVKGLISASAIGFYGFDTGRKIMEENDHAGEDFLAKVVQDWEHELIPLQKAGIQSTAIRIGIVLSRDGGALPKLEIPVQLGVGAALGSGSQYMSWIHINDLCGIFKHVITNQLSGIYNAVAPNPVTNKEFTKTLAKKLNRPFFLPNVPAFGMKVLLGEMAAIVLGGNKVSAEKIKSSGYHFQFETLDSAIKSLYN